MNREPRAQKRALGRPWITPGLVAVASLLAVAPGAGALLQYDRAAIQGGEIWRLVTGQLVHWTPRMALADLGVLLLLGFWLELRSRLLAATVMGGGALLAGAGLYCFEPGLDLYRGSSSVASALFVAGALLLAGRSSRGWERAGALAALLLFAAKLFWELQAGRALAAGPLPPGVTVTPAAHLLGGLAGLMAVILRSPAALVRPLPEKV